jgi:ankyrin repeat protein
LCGCTHAEPSCPDVLLLRIATFYGYQDFLHQLIDKGANVSAAEKDGKTPLDIALEEN